MFGLSKIICNWVHRQDGAVAVEFVIAIPFILSLFFGSVDAGISMIRQVMLDRSMDLTLRQVRLGNPDFDTSDELKASICDGMATVMSESECLAGITIEMSSIDPANTAGLTATVKCVNREEDIIPAVAFTPGPPNKLMLVRTCIVSDPFIQLTGFFTGMPINENGEYVAVSRGVFVNEPS